MAAPPLQIPDPAAPPDLPNAKATPGTTASPIQSPASTETTASLNLPPSEPDSDTTNLNQSQSGVTETPVGAAAAGTLPIGPAQSVESGANHGEVTNPQPAPSIPNLGAWAKPPRILPPNQMSEIAINPLDVLWPSLSEVRQVTTRQQREGNSKIRASQLSNKSNATKPVGPKLPVELVCPPEMKEDGTLRYPWAAKMNPSTRNLYRTTTPTYMEDGTPKVTIPRHLLLHGPENQKEYVIGQFYRCSTPPGGLIHAVVNRIWGRNCRIFTRKLSDSSYLFHVPDAATRTWILQRGLWHIDGCLLFVAEWAPTATLSLPEISTAPVWVTLKNIPEQLYSRWGISRIASALGEPMLTNKPWLDPTLMGEAKLMVEVELDKPFPQRIALDDTHGKISMVDVEYSWIPIKCGRCGHLGHKESRCLQGTSTKPQDLHQSSRDKITVSVSVGEAVPPTTINIPSQNFVSAPTAATASETLAKELVPIVVTTTIVDTVSADEAAAPDLMNATESVAPILVSDPQVATILVSDPQASANVVDATTSSEVSTLEKAEITETRPITSIAAETSLIVQDNAISHVAHSTSDSSFSTPSLARASSSNVQLVENVNTSNRFVDISTGYMNEEEYYARSRGGRPIKPSLKAQEMQWTTVGGNRGRGGKGGRGSYG